MTYIPGLLRKTPPDAESLFSAVDKINANLDAIAAELANISGRGSYDFRKTQITGGGEAALDGINGTILVGGETAIVIVGDNPASVYTYVLDPDDGRPQEIPYVIIPLANAGSKRWILASRVERLWNSGGAPTASDDITKGVQPGDDWKAGNDLWKCANNSAGSAEWIKLLKVGTTAGTACEGSDARIIAAVAHGQATAPHSGHATTTALAATQTALAAHDSAAAPHTGHATIDGGRVVQDPANATATPGANKIPVANVAGLLDGWISKMDVVGGRLSPPRPLPWPGRRIWFPQMVAS